MDVQAAELLFCPCFTLSPLHNLPRLDAMSEKAAGQQGSSSVKCKPYNFKVRIIRGKHNSKVKKIKVQ